jgi:hypothetical protein
LAEIISENNKAYPTLTSENSAFSPETIDRDYSVHPKNQGRIHKEGKMGAKVTNGWLSKRLITELRSILSRLYGHNHDDMELQRIGLNIARFVYVKEMANVQ